MSILTWKHASRARGGAERSSRYASVTSATYASSSVGSRAGRGRRSRRRGGRGSPASARARGAVWTTQHLRLLALLDRDRRDARRARAGARPRRPSIAVDLDLDHASGRRRGSFSSLRRALGDDLALGDHGDPVAELRRPRTCSASSAGRSCRPAVSEAIVAAQLAGADRVDADRRLVEEDDRRVVQQPARDVEPLAHAARVALDALLLAAREADELEQLGDPRLLLARRDGVELGEVAQVVEAGEPLVERRARRRRRSRSACRTSRASLTTSWPSTRAEPEVGIRSVISILIVVVLPAPFGPSRPKSSPSPISKLTPAHGLDLERRAAGSCRSWCGTCGGGCRPRRLPSQGDNCSRRRRLFALKRLPCGDALAARGRPQLVRGLRARRSRRGRRRHAPRDRVAPGAGAAARRRLPRARRGAHRREPLRRHRARHARDLHPPGSPAAAYLPA